MTVYWKYKMKKILYHLIIIIVFFSAVFEIFASENEYFKKGLTHYTKDEFQLAAESFEEAKNIDAMNAQLYFYLGNSYYQLNELDKAILNFTAGLNFTENKGIYFYNLANCYYLKGNYDFAAQMYKKAVHYDTKLYDSYLNAGNAYYKEGNYPDTIIQWETYLEKHPQTPQYENIQKAIAYLKEEIEQPQADKNVDEKTGLDRDLLNDVLSNLDKLVNSTENILETSEKPVDDLSVEDIER